MVLFAVQNGGSCAAAGNLNGYKKYGKSGKCRNGKGGPWANDVYRITNPIRPVVPKGRYTSSGSRALARGVGIFSPPWRPYFLMPK